MIRKKRMLMALSVFCLCAIGAQAQRIALKTNALYWATLTPNIEFEARLAPKVTADISVAGNFAKIKQYNLIFASVEPEIRFWPERPMARHFIGVAAMMTNYQLKFEQTHHYGDALGAGLVYGYAFVLNQRWNIETSLGVGLAKYQEKRFRDIRPDKTNNEGWAVVPMRVGITLSYILR